MSGSEPSDPGATNPARPPHRPEASPPIAQARPDEGLPPAAPVALPGPGDRDGARSRLTIALDRRNVWSVSWTIVAVVIVQFLLFVVSDGGLLIFTLFMSWVASVAMEPAVSRLATRMSRGGATILVMVGVLLVFGVFAVAFGRVLGDQIATFVRNLPDLVRALTTWVNERFDTNLDASTLLTSLDLTPAQLGNIALNAAGGVLGILASILGNVFSVFTFAFFTFYLSADAPRLQRWIARLFPPQRQAIVSTVWELAIAKTGGYVSARLVLAAVCGTATALFLLVIGMPYWLALGMWTGVVAQFVPTIGTYIAIALPVFVGLVGPNPIQGVLALGFALVYQQVENLTLEPRISARAVDVHPAASFGAVMLGASLFGVAGAFIGVPMAALVLALTDIYARKYELLPQFHDDSPGPTETPDADAPKRQSRLAELLRRSPPGS